MNGDLPRWVWRGTLAGVALVIVVVAVAAIALGTGAADPPVAGPVTWSDARFAWAGGPSQRLAAESAAWIAAPEALVPAPDAGFTLTVRARLDADAGPLAAWGVWIASEDGTRMLYAITAHGYWTIRTCAPDVAATAIDDCPAADPEWRWRTYPRIHAAGAANRITLHREVADVVRLRINGERLGAPVVVPGATWGVWARGGAVTTRITWETASIARAY